MKSDKIKTSLSLYGVPDVYLRKRQGQRPCTSVYPPVTALRSLSSVALSSAQAILNVPYEVKNEAKILEIQSTLRVGF
jgi:hypothetical protein